MKHLIVFGIFLLQFSCKNEKTQQQIEYEKIDDYIPSGLNSYGFVLPVASEVSEVHQLFNDLQANFFFYQDKANYEKIADKIIELDPEYPSGYLLKSFYETDTIEYKKLIEKAFELSKTTLLISERYMVQADYYLLIEEDYTKSQEYFQKALDMYPNSVAAAWSLGMAYYYDEKYDKAMECYKKSIELIPGLPKGYEMIAGIYYRRKDYKTALEYIEKAKENGANTKNDIYFAEFEAYVYLRNEFYEQTIQHVKKAYDYGEKFINSDYLKKAYNQSKAKLDSIQSFS